MNQVNTLFLCMDVILKVLRDFILKYISKEISQDIDGNEVLDICNLDNNDDSIEDIVNDCTLVNNTDQNDSDGDGIRDACDPDVDVEN